MVDVNVRKRIIDHLNNYAAYKGCVPRITSYDVHGNVVHYGRAERTYFEFRKGSSGFARVVNWDEESIVFDFESVIINKIKCDMYKWLERMGEYFCDGLAEGLKEPVTFNLDVASLYPSMMDVTVKELVNEVFDNKKERNMNTFDRLASRFGINCTYGSFSHGTTFKFANQIKDVIFNPPATIVLWKDGTKTVVKATGEDEYDPEKGMAMAFSKKLLGDKYEYYNTFKHYLKKWDKKCGEQVNEWLSEGFKE